MKLGLSIYRATLASSCLLQVLLLGASVANAELIPAGRLYVGWPSAGVTGGIPDSSKMPVYTTITSTGNTTDRTAALNTAFANCPSNQVVVLGAGNFRVTAQLSMINRKGVVVRGAGRGVTVIQSTHTGAWGWVLGNTSADYHQTAGASLSVNALQFTNVLGFSSTSTYNVGDVVALYQDNSSTAAWPVVGTGGNAGRDMHFETKVVAKTATTVTVLDPIPYAFTTAQNAVLHVVQDGFAVRSGIEDLTFDFSVGAGAVYGISLWNADNCWLKNVEINRAANYLVYMLKSLHCTMQECYLNSINGTGNNGSGLLMESSCLNLIQNNMIRYCFPNIEINYGSSGNVFGYNAMKESQGNIGIDGNHGAHNAFNLYEGNVAPNIKPDGYFGSVSHDTVIRNRFTGADDIGGTQGFATVDLKRFTRYYNVVGNVLGIATSGDYEQTGSGNTGAAIYQLGYPNIGNTVYSGTVQPSAGSWWSSWPTAAIPSGYQERDLDVASTLIRKGNYNSINAGIPASESLGGDAVPNSYYLTSKPAWFGSLTWPPFDPAAAATAAYRTSLNASYVAIPAGYRYVNGVNPPSGPVNLQPVVVAIASPKSGTSPLTVVFSSTGSADPEGVALSYAWTFGDGKTSTAANPTNIYLTSGSFTARLTVSDGTNTVSSTNLTISVLPTLNSIVVTPVGPSMAVGGTQQFTATGTATDGSTQNVTSSATWTSANTGVATITTGGLVTGAGVGSSLITATLSGVSGSSTLTVQAAPVAITTSSLPGGNANLAYTGTLTASGGKSPYAWSLASGSLPTGLLLNATSGGITGTPTATGTFNFTVLVSDASSPVQSATKAFSITVVSVPTTVGNDSEGTLTDNIQAGWINAGRVQVANDLTVGTVFAKLKAAPGNFKCAIYSDASGQPSRLLRSSAAVNNPSDGWQSFPLASSLTLTNGQSYWLAVWSDDATAKIYYSDTSGVLRWGAYNYGTWPDPIVTTGGGNFNYCIYAASTDAITPPSRLRVAGSP